LLRYGEEIYATYKTGKHNIGHMAYSESFYSRLQFIFCNLEQYYCRVSGYGFCLYFKPWNGSVRRDNV